MLETERLFIRKLTTGDEPFIFELVNQPSFIENIGDRGVKTLDDAAGYIGRCNASYEQKGFGLYLVGLKETGEPVGMNGLLKRDGLDDVEIGFAFLERHFGKGYAYESSVAVMEHGWNDIGLKRIVAIAKPGNTSSTKLLEKLGMKYQGMVAVPGLDGQDKFFTIERED